MQNPFTLTFGKSPLESIERPLQVNEIINAFTAEPVNQQIFLLTGIRGSGKTVMMTDISHKLNERNDWIVIELNPSTDLLNGMLSKLYSNQFCAGLIQSAKINLSFFGFGIEWHRNGRFSSDHRHRNRNYYNITVREKSRKTCFNYY